MIASSSQKRDFSKMVVTYDMVEHMLGKYGNKWYDDDAMADVILEDL